MGEGRNGKGGGRDGRHVLLPLFKLGRLRGSDASMS